MSTQVFRINYKSDFVLNMQCDAGWAIPFTIKFWSKGLPTSHYFVSYDGTTYTNCSVLDGNPTVLRATFDDHHLGCGELKYQITYHMHVDDFRTHVEDDVFNVSNITVIDDTTGEELQVVLNFEGETAPEIVYAIPAYEAEAERQAAEAQRVLAEAQREENELARQSAETQRQAEFNTAQQQRTADFNAQEQDFERRYQAAEGTESGSRANDGSRWGAYKAAEAQREATFDEMIGDLSDLESKVDALPTNQELEDMLDAKQNVLSFDNEPTTGSSNPVTSAGIKEYVDSHVGDTSELEAAVDAIEAKIPSAASSSNQLADKAFVNSSISTNTATFKGTFNSLSELQAVTGATNNDYGFVIEYDEQGNEYYDRYKYNGTAWVYEYKIESTPFTAAQWAAIQSGITSGDVTKLAALPTNAQLTALLAAKQDTISDLASIRSGASAGATAYQKPSSGIPKSDLSSEVQQAINSGGSSPTITMDDTPTSGSSNPVKSSGIYNALQGKQNTLTFDSTPIASSSNPVTSGGVKTALDLKANQSTTYTKTEVDAMYDDVVFLGDPAGSASSASFDAQADTVWNKAQVLSAAQQAQARSNIGAQEALVSGANIKTINNESILGSGNITISGGGGGSGEANVIESISINGTAQAVTNKNVNLTVPTSSTVTAIVTLTEAQYTDLATKDGSTLYIITA